MDALTTLQQQQVADFQNVSGIDSIDTCIEWLKAHDWHVQAAVESLLSGPSSDFTEVINQNLRHRKNATAPQESNQANPHIANSATRQTQPRLGINAALPRPSPQPMSFWQRLFYPITLSLKIIWVLVSATASIFPFSLLFPRQPQLPSPPSSTSFLLTYESHIPPTTPHPAFFTGTYSQALEVAKRELRVMLVILLSYSHDDTIEFIQSVLADQEVLRVFEEKRVVVWGGDVGVGEGFVVSNTLLATTYPFISLITPTPTSPTSTTLKMVVATRMEGLATITARSIIGAVEAAVVRCEAGLRGVRVERERQETTRSMREQQEKAYLASLKADQEKARRAQEERTRLEQAAREEQEKISARDRKRAEKIARKQRLRDTLLAEPDSDDTIDVAKVGVRLPGGERLVRRFKASVATVQDLYDYIETQDLTPLPLDADFEVINSYPRRVLSDKTQTIKDAGLYPSSSVMVEECDEE